MGFSLVVVEFWFDCSLDIFLVRIDHPEKAVEVIIRYWKRKKNEMRPNMGEIYFYEG